MRMRKKKNGAARLLLCSEFLLSDIDSPMGSPAEKIGMQKDTPVYLEIGAGKGAFACGMAARHTDACYYAMERVTDCVVIAAERAASIGDGLKNLKFTIDKSY